MNNQEALTQEIQVAIAQAFGIEDQEQLLQVIQSLSDECIQNVANVIVSSADKNKKLQTIQQLVSKDIQKSQKIKAEKGTKLKYIKSLKWGAPGDVDSTQGMKPNKKQSKMLPKHDDGGAVDLVQKFGKAKEGLDKIKSGINAMTTAIANQKSYDAYFKNAYNTITSNKQNVALSQSTENMKNNIMNKPLKLQDFNQSFT